MCQGPSSSSVPWIIISSFPPPMGETADFDDPSENPSFKCQVTDTWMRPQDAGWESQTASPPAILFHFTLHHPTKLIFLKHQFPVVLAVWIQEQAKLLKQDSQGQRIHQNKSPVLSHTTVQSRGPGWQAVLLHGVTWGPSLQDPEALGFLWTPRCIYLDVCMSFLTSSIC